MWRIVWGGSYWRPERSGILPRAAVVKIEKSQIHEMSGLRAQ